MNSEHTAPPYATAGTRGARRFAQHSRRRRRVGSPRDADAVVLARGAPGDGGGRRARGDRSRQHRSIRHRPARRRARSGTGRLRGVPDAARPPQRRPDHHAHRAGFRGRRGARPRGGSRRLRHQAVRAGRAAQPDPGRAPAGRHARDGRRGAGGRADRARPRPARGDDRRASPCGSRSPSSSCSTR